MATPDDDATSDEPLPGDALVPDAQSQITRQITLAATPEAVWATLLEIVQERARPAPPGRHQPLYTTLISDAPHALVLGALHDHAVAEDLPFDHDRPAEYWHATWALVLTPVEPHATRLRVRSRVAFTGEAMRWTAVWMHPFNDFMDPEVLHGIKARAEHRT